MKINNIKKIIFIIFIFIAFLNISNTNAIYREKLSTTISLDIVNSFKVTFDPHNGEEIFSISRANGEEVGPLTTPTKTGYNFVGWYTTESGGEKVEVNRVITGDVTFHAHYEIIVCKKAASGSLHTETCGISSSNGCALLDYDENDTITYGTIPSVNSPFPGDAYDCDVNNNGNFEATERFYFLRNTDNGNIALIHYTSFDENGRTSGISTNIDYSYNNALTYLPTSSTWTNPKLRSMSGNVTRFISDDDMEIACGSSIETDNNSYLSNCYYILENTKFYNNNASNSGIWIGDGSYLANASDFIVSNSESESVSSARPVIEIPYVNLDGYHERNTFTITLETNGGNNLHDLSRYENQHIGTLPTPERDQYRFDGWYIDDETFENPVSPDMIITKNETFYAKWTYVADTFPIVFEQTGACTFNGKNAYITGDECADYHDKKYIDTGIALFSNENYNKDFEVSFKIVSYNANNQEHTQSTFFDSKLENVSLTYPGFVFRKSNNGLQLTEKIEGVDASKLFTYSPNETYTIYRIDGKIYYSVNGSARTFFQDTAGFSHQFALTSWFGAYAMESDVNATGANSTADRYIKATLSNMYIRLGTYPTTSVKVYFDPGEGTASQLSKDVVVNSQIGDLPLATRPGFLFDGWYTSNNVKITPTTIITESITLSAHYLPAVTVTFNAGTGGTSSKPSITLAQNTSIGASNLPTATKRGFVFDGWYTAPSDGTKIDGTEIITSNTDYYAQYFNGITITFNPDGGSASFLEKDIIPNTAVGELPTVSKTNCIFDNWYIDDGTYTTIVDETTVFSANTNVIAKWDEIHYVAKITKDNRKFETLQAAVTAARSYNEKVVIQFLDDISNETISVASNANIEFDLQSYTFSTSGTKALITNNGTIDIKNGTFLSTSTTSKRYVIDNKSTGTVNISGGLIRATGTNAIGNVGTINMTGGRVECSATDGAINNDTGGVLNMSGGQVVNTSVKGKQAIYNDGGTLTISENAYLENSSNNGTNTRAALQNNAGTVYILGGTIVSNNYIGVVNNDTMTIGNDDGTIDTTTPVIQGKTIGLSINSGKTVNYYDGVIKGKTNAVDVPSRLVVDTANGVQTSTSTDANGYETMILEIP